MIYLFRIFSGGGGDYLEFSNRQSLIEAYLEHRDSRLYDWSTVPIKQAIQEEGRLSKIYSLRAMQNLGDKMVVRVLVKGQLEWYSPSNAHGIPSEYNVAVKFFTHACTHYKLTTCHHEVFEIAKESRFKALSQEVIQSILKRVEGTRCDSKLDLYLNMNLRKLRNYGVESLKVKGSYVDIKDAIAQQSVSCPFFSQFLLNLMDVCITKEIELVGKQRVYEKVI